MLQDFTRGSVKWGRRASARPSQGDDDDEQRERLKASNAERFKSHLGGPQPSKSAPRRKRKRGLIVGTSTQLEKSYLRLTSDPKPELVRPRNMLLKALAHVKDQWVQHEDYEWACDQLKAIRQDLVVQGICDQFAMDVYRSHSRIALESGDINEYKQCQVRLGEMRDEGVKSSMEETDEFQAYHLLYCAYQEDQNELVRALSELGSSQLTMTPGSSTRHAIDVIKSLASDNYQAFFKLYAQAPHMSGYLMDYKVNRMRKVALSRMVRAYMPSIDIDYVTASLQFSSREDCRKFLIGAGGVLTPGKDALDTKATRAHQGNGKHKHRRGPA
ncbi:unnamed protein product [Chrysoparadoxa australica]